MGHASAHHHPRGLRAKQHLVNHTYHHIGYAFPPIGTTSTRLCLECEHLAPGSCKVHEVSSAYGRAKDAVAVLQSDVYGCSASS